MGRGDRRTKKGKIWRGSTGNSRPKKKNEKPKDEKPKDDKKASKASKAS